MFSSSRFTNIVVKWPGSTHDSFILNNSGIPDAMTGINGWLLGDSGYHKTDRHKITEILLKVALNTIKLNQTSKYH
jgi:hypothetical protein